MAVAPAEYARAARRQAELILPRLTVDGRGVLEQAEAEAREADDDHVGTEHVVLGMLALANSVGGRALTDIGLTRARLLEQRHHEEGHSPPGRIPRTPRTNRIIALGGEIAQSRGDDTVTSGHLLLGVIAESREWGASGRSGPHHLREAAKAVGKRLPDVAEAVEKHMRTHPSQPRG